MEPAKRSAKIRSDSPQDEPRLSMSSSEIRHDTRKDQVRNKRQVVTSLVADKGVVVTRAILVKNLLRVYIRKDFRANYLALFKIQGDNRQII